MYLTYAITDVEGIGKQFSDLRATDKSRYVAIAYFNNCVVIQFIISRPYSEEIENNTWMCGSMKFISSVDQSI